MDDNDNMFYAKAKGKEYERELKLSGQPFGILHCLFNEYEPKKKKASVPIDTVLYEAGIKSHKRGEYISGDKVSQLHVKVKTVRDELETADFNQDNIKVINKHCELYIECRYDI